MPVAARTKYVSVRLAPYERAQLDRLAAALDVHPSEAVRLAIESLAVENAKREAS